MNRNYVCKTLMVLLLLSVIVKGNPVKAESPVLYYEPFETMEFLRDDILEHAKWRTAESRKLKYIIPEKYLSMRNGEPLKAVSSHL